MSTLADRCGPLLAAARVFAEAHDIADEPRGPAAARALARAVDRFCHTPAGSDPDEDDRFVEGAGAFLGVVLIATYGGRGHVRRDATHRVQIGTRGFFDPFGAIDAALDADDPLAALAASLELAEAEAQGHGPVARSLAAFESALASALPSASIRDAFVLDVELADGTQIDISRLADAPDDTTRRGMAERIVGMLPGARDHAREAPDPNRLFPRPIGPAFLESLPGDARLVTYTSTSGLLVAIVELHPGRARFLRESELDDHQGGLTGVRDAALRNLARRPAPRLVGRDFGGIRLLEARTGDGLDAARVLLPATREMAARALPGAAWVTVPHRDTALFARAEDAEPLRAASRDLVARAPHPIADALFPLDGL